MNYVVLLSGGLDSTTALAYVKETRYSTHDNILAVGFDYGQKHRVQELHRAFLIAELYSVPYHIIDLKSSDVFIRSTSALLNTSDKEIPKSSYDEQLKQRPGIVDTYVPFRNGLMISMATALGLSYFGNEKLTVVIGAHKDDAAGNAYPDCSHEFCSSMHIAMNWGTDHLAHLWAPFVSYTKAEIVKLGLGLNVPYEKTWSCYEGGKVACGQCGTCRDRIKAFEINNANDPIIYATGVI